MTSHPFLQYPEEYRVVQFSRENHFAMDWSVYSWIWPALHSRGIFQERQWHCAQWCRTLDDLKRKKPHKHCMTFFLCSSVRPQIDGTCSSQHKPVVSTPEYLYLDLSVFFNQSHETTLNDTCCSLAHQINYYLIPLLANIFYITQHPNHFSSKPSRHRWYEHSYMDKNLIVLNSDNEKYRNFTFQHSILLI